MDISALRGAQSFEVKTLDKKPTSEELKALENNGKVDIVLQDGEQTVILSGEKIDINEYSQKMGKALPSFKEGPWGRIGDLHPLKMMDKNEDGFLVEKETRKSLGEAWNYGTRVAAKGASGASDYMAMNGMALGMKTGKSSMMTAGYYAGRAVGFFAGIGVGAYNLAVGTVGSIGDQKSVNTWNITNNLKDIR